MTPHDNRFHRQDAPRAAGFDFTAAMRGVCADMVQRLEPLGHIDLARVAFSFSQTRKPVSGTYASLTPLRFALGSLETVRRGRKWTIQRFVDRSGGEMLYILRFYVPRYLDLPLEAKLTTVIHELWHISPRFDGDLRRFRGRCYAHSGRQKNFDAHASRLARQWLSLQPPASLYGFLRGSFRDLVAEHGRVCGTKMPAPRLIPVETAGQYNSTSGGNQFPP